jgi:hypothetical protein
VDPFLADPNRRRPLLQVHRAVAVVALDLRQLPPVALALRDLVGARLEVVEDALLAVAIAGGPGPALHHHLLAARELTAAHPGSLADLIAMRAAAWLWAQLPLSVPVGLVGARLARHRVTHLPAHELSPSALG